MGMRKANEVFENLINAAHKLNDIRIEVDNAN